MKRRLETEMTPEGEQTLVPGVDPISEAERLAKLANAPLTKPSKPCNIGLFDDAARKQADLFDD